MERESFESEEIAKILNEKFVSVKVDREERPDVDKVYMTYIQVSVMKYTLIYFIRSCSRKHLYVYHRWCFGFSISEWFLMNCKMHFVQVT